MMYHCLAIAAAPTLATEAAESVEDDVHDAVQRHVDHPEVGRNEDHRDDDDDRRPVDLLAGGPRGLLELGPDLLEELPDASEPVHGALPLPGGASRPAFVRAPRAGPLAGQEGFEPPTSGFGDRRSSH